MGTEQPITGLALLRQPFPKNQISKLPKETKAQIDERKADRTKGVSCVVCGGWHHRNAVHLDYVGHAALTDRLLEADPAWTWEPLAVGPDGLPQFDKSGGLWIRLTVCGVSRLGYGNAEGKSHMDVGAREKEVIGDALRNAAMRFGAALDLWHKGQLHDDDGDVKDKTSAPAPTKVVDTKTGEEVAPERAAAPSGYYYLSSYRQNGEWHEAVVLKWDLQGGGLRVSTKRQALGDLLRQFCQDGVPVSVDVTVKKNSKGEAYLNAIHSYSVAQGLNTPQAMPAPEITAADIPFAPERQS